MKEDKKKAICADVLPTTGVSEGFGRLRAERCQLLRRADNSQQELNELMGTTVPDQE
jgi:hypothetical protein